MQMEAEHESDACDAVGCLSWMWRAALHSYPLTARCQTLHNVGWHASQIPPQIEHMIPWTQVQIMIYL